MTGVVVETGHVMVTVGQLVEVDQVKECDHSNGMYPLSEGVTLDESHCLPGHNLHRKNNNNTSICKAHNVSIRAESEAPKGSSTVLPE